MFFCMFYRVSGQMTEVESLYKATIPHLWTWMSRDSVPGDGDDEVANTLTTKPSCRNNLK